MAKLIAKTAHTYGNKWRQPGENYEANETDAKILVGIGKATRAAATAPASTAAPADADNLDALRAEYELLTGEKPHHFTKAPGLAAKIAQIKAAKDAEGGQSQ